MTRTPIPKLSSPFTSFAAAGSTVDIFRPHNKPATYRRAIQRPSAGA
jgi:hypothetical protein